MNRWIKRGLIALVVLALLAGALLFTGLQMEQRKRDRRVAVPAYSLAQADDAQALERGKYLFSSRGCAECHGANGAGHVFIDSGGLRAKSPNISSGAGGVVGSYGMVDWERTIRHGVKPDGRPVFIMPSEDYNRFTDADVAALIAYARSLRRARPANASRSPRSFARHAAGTESPPPRRSRCAAARDSRRSSRCPARSPGRRSRTAR